MSDGRPLAPPASASFLSPIPLVFVVLWSSGFIVARFGLPYAPPLTFLSLRFLGVLALLSMTIGTLYQKRYCPQFDLRTGTVIQFSAALLVIVPPLAIAFEGLTPDFAGVQWTVNFVGAWLWSVPGLSIGAIFLLFALIRRSHATQVTSLMYLTPPTTALMARLMFGEALSAAGMAGMALAVLGVAFVVKPANP